MSDDARRGRAPAPDAGADPREEGRARPSARPHAAGRAGTPEGGPAAADPPLLAELMPWSVAPPRLGRDWVVAPDAAALEARWQALLGAADGADRSALFGPTRSRTLHSAVAPLPGRPAHGARLAREQGPCPEPVRVLYGPYDARWLLPDARLLDAARPELWRVADDRQTHLVETGGDRQAEGPAVCFTTLLPVAHSPAGRPGRIRPLHRRPGGAEPNLAPGLSDWLAARLGTAVSAEDVLAWIAALARGGPHGCAVPLTDDPELWRRGVALGRRSLWLHTGGTRGGAPEAAAGGGPRAPRLPGGRRPYVRAPLPARPGPEELRYDAEEQALHVGPGRLAPVEATAWEFAAGGGRVLESWYAGRTERGAAGTLAAIGPRAWPQEWTSELLALVTVLTLLAELRPALRELAEQVGPGVGRGELRRAGVLPPPAAARRPASVLDLREEGPDGQLALL